MAEFNLDECWPRIVGFYPCYRPDGSNSTCIVFRDGSRHVDNRRTKTFLQSTARIFASDLTALRRNYQGFLGCKGMVPLALHSIFILVPFKVRKPQYKDHGATGYAVLNQIRYVEEMAHVSQQGPQKDAKEPARGKCVSRLAMNGGITLESMEKASTLKRRLGEAAQVRQEYCRFFGGSSLLPLDNFVQGLFTGVPSVSGARGVPQVPQVLGLPGIPSVYGVSGAPGAQGGTGAPGAPEASGVPVSPSVPVASGVPVALGVPQIPGVIYHIHFHTETTSDRSG